MSLLPVYYYVAEEGSIPVFVLRKQGQVFSWRGVCLGLKIRRAQGQESCIGAYLIDHCIDFDLYDSLYLAIGYLVRFHGNRALGQVLDLDRSSRDFCQKNRVVIEGDSFSLNFFFGLSSVLNGRRWCKGLYVTGAVRQGRVPRCDRVGQIRQKVRMFYALQGRIFLVPQSNYRELGRVGLLSDNIRLLPHDLGECMAIFESLNTCPDPPKNER